MANAEEVEEKVIHSISEIADAFDKDGRTVTKKTRLFEDLEFNFAFRRELAKPMSKISLSYGGARVAKSEAGKLETVEDACKLVIKKIPS